ncbi:hypothetical protein OBBRIDRAFT_455218 [Obba rivulosa]|uniref:Uncharacterized protein n=1 Tax=Obba rivulosa TaxID=1052685 RepID=A0A8E2AWI6_9APHY|nr:hypothetical protein OBBRIDRAFT_455218 [Obba rivulosa]
MALTAPALTNGHPAEQQSAFMAPIPSSHDQPDLYFGHIKSQWENPTDILSILMIIGGDIVQRAIAQLAGPGPGPLSFAPVAFSFGWVSYALTALLSAVGDRRLLPPVDGTAVLVNAADGYHRTIQSWPLSRLVRDHEPPHLHRVPHGHSQNGLCISFFRTIPGMRTGVPESDWVYWFSISVIAAQLVVSIVPGVVRGNWMVFIIAAGGTILALATGALPQWHAEKWQARPIKKGSKEVVCLTHGNGGNYVIVIISDDTSIRLADLANGREIRSNSTVFATCILFVLWIVLLVTIEGLSADAWYSLAVGALGMVQNVVAAGAERTPGALGFHLEEVSPGGGRNFVHERKVFEALKEAENVVPRVGISLLPIFFPGNLLPEEEAWKRRTLAQYEDRSEYPQLSVSPPALHIHSDGSITPNTQIGGPQTKCHDYSAVSLQHSDTYMPAATAPEPQIPLATIPNFITTLPSATYPDDGLGPEAGAEVVEENLQPCSGSEAEHRSANERPWLSDRLSTPSVHDYHHTNTDAPVQMSQQHG